ncbi:hypothetical protein [Quadrisphaera sp. KR29]|uniref:hypothetical protein n=1 Tax=Quadrisphaera sp. KR29 TaxID=3461391 RepID=UPI004044FBFA
MSLAPLNTPGRDDVVLRVERRRPARERLFQRVVRQPTGELTVDATPWLPVSVPFNDGGRDLPWQPVDIPAHRDLTALLKASRALTALLPDQDAHYRVTEAELSRHELAGLLRPSLGGGPEYPATGDEGGPDEEQDVDVQGAVPFHRSASVNGAAVVVLRLPSATSSAPRAADLLCLLADGEDGGLRGSDVIASSLWWSDDEITSWDGGSVVERAGRAAVLVRGTGDEIGTPVVRRWPSTRRAQAQLLARWVEEQNAEVTAALCWEPLDPTRRRLTARERFRWEEALAGVSATVEVMDPSLRRAVQALLRADEASLYAGTRRALLHPRSPEGEELYERLDAVACGGALGELLAG